MILGPPVGWGIPALAPLREIGADHGSRFEG